MQSRNIVKETRLRLDLTIAEISVVSGCSSNTLVMVEKHNYLPKLRTRQKIADALKVDVSLLWPDVTEGGNNE